MDNEKKFKFTPEMVAEMTRIARESQMRKRKSKEWLLEPAGDNEWVFVEPADVYAAYDIFDRACELMWANRDKDAKKVLKGVLKVSPGHIDAIHHLAMLLDRSGNGKEARELWAKGVEIGRRALPPKFRKGGKLDWGFLENRPFLRCLHGLGLSMLADGKKGEALPVFEEILSYNPNDNQGVREILTELYLDKGDIDAAIRICKRYRGDTSPGISYVYPLALFMKGEREKATMKLRSAIKGLPKVADELLADRHREPKDFDPECITWGGADHAYEHWTHFGRFWDENAREWLLDIEMKMRKEELEKEGIAKHGRKKKRDGLARLWVPVSDAGENWPKEESRSKNEGQTAGKDTEK